MPHRPSQADTEYARRAFRPMVGNMTAREWDATTGYKTAAGALDRAAAWRRLLAYAGVGAFPHSWCLAAHAACIEDARRLREHGTSSVAH